MNLVQEPMPAVDRLSDDSFEIGYLRALADSGVIDDKDPVPPRFDALLDQHLAERRDSRGGRS